MPKPNQHVGEANRLNQGQGAARYRPLAAEWGRAAAPHRSARPFLRASQATRRDTNDDPARLDLSPRNGVERPRRTGRRGLSAGIASDALDWVTVAGPALTDSIQDYLKAIYKLQEGEARVSITALAREQGITPGSASEMVKKLAALDLVEHRPTKAFVSPPRASGSRSR